MPPRFTALSSALAAARTASAEPSDFDSSAARALFTAVRAAERVSTLIAARRGA
jgi:hypothetical protein